MNGVLTAGPVWYLIRGSGVVSLLLLTAVSALGMATVSRWRPGRVPRFVTLGLHRNLSLLAVVFLSIHVLTAVIDPDASVRLVSVFVPSLSDRYGLWLGLAALALDLVIALVVTSLVRGRLPDRLWRAVHWLAYLAWPVALLHGAGMGTDNAAAWMLAVDGACIALFGAAVALRLLNAPRGAGKHLEPNLEPNLGAAP
jgi:sulfoxide reductase heme-binding subunit YedZ